MIFLIFLSSDLKHYLCVIVALSNNNIIDFINFISSTSLIVLIYYKFIYSTWDQNIEFQVCCSS